MANSSAIYSTIISDLDGTLLMPDHHLGKLTVDTLTDLTQRGVQFVVATGRPFLDVHAIFTAAGLDDLYLITSNGARIDNMKSGNLYLNTLDNDIARKLTTLSFDPEKVCVNTYEANGWFIDRDVPELATFHQDSGFGYQVVDFHHHQFQDVEKVFFLARDGEPLKPIEEKIKKLFGNSVKWTYSAPHCLEVMNADVSKASALQHLFPAHKLESAIAFGDGLNDVEMLSLVKTGCIMENADPRLVLELPHLKQIGSNAEQGVATHLIRIFEKEG